MPDSTETAISVSVLCGLPWVSKVSGPETAVAHRGQKVSGGRGQPSPIASAAHAVNNIHISTVFQLSHKL